jgi:hypothetical protein
VQSWILGLRPANLSVHSDCLFSQKCHLPKCESLVGLMSKHHEIPAFIPSPPEWLLSMLAPRPVRKKPQCRCTSSHPTPDHRALLSKKEGNSSPKSGTQSRCPLETSVGNTRLAETAHKKIELCFEQKGASGNHLCLEDTLQYVACVLPDFSHWRVCVSFCLQK